MDTSGFHVSGHNVSAINWEKIITHVIIETSGTITSSTSSSITFTKNTANYNIDFSKQLIVLTKIPNQVPIFRFPKIPPMIMLLKNYMKNKL